MSVPLALFDRPIGVITVVSGLGRQFTQDDLALLSTIAVGLSLSAAGFILPSPDELETEYAGSLSFGAGQLSFSGARADSVPVGQ